MPIKPSKQINLVPQEEFDSSLFGRILKWALSTFRVMVIVTELVVMSAFLSRFWLDSRNSDLNDQIAVEKNQVLAYSDIEKQFRRIQTKLVTAKSYYESPSTKVFLQTISNYLPVDLSLTSISTVDGILTIKASAYSERSIAQLLINLETDKKLSDVKLTQVVTNNENAAITDFVIKATILGGGK